MLQLHHLITGLREGRSSIDITAQSTKDTVAAKVESNVASTTVNESPHLANGKEADAAADQTMDIDSSSKVVVESENQSNKDQPYKVANTEPQSHHTLSSGQSSMDVETASSTLEFTTRKDETNETPSYVMPRAHATFNHHQMIYYLLLLLPPPLMIKIKRTLPLYNRINKQK